MLKGWTTGRLLSWLKWSEGRLKNFVAQRYEPILRFDPTPVYDVTLAEDMAINQAYPINTAGVRAVLVRVYVPTLPSEITGSNGIRVRVYISDTDYGVVGLGSATGNSNRDSTILAYPVAGYLQIQGVTKTGTSVSGAQNSAILVDTDLLSYTSIPKVLIASMLNDNMLPAGTRITIYIATSAVNTQDGILNIGLASESDVRVLL